MNIRGLITKVRRALFGGRRDRDVDDEIRFHLSQEARLGALRGLTAEEAARKAQRSFGSVLLAKESTRAVWMSTTLEQVAQDLRFGTRILTKSPGLSATAVLLIALVIGGNTTVFSIAHAILDKPMPGVRAAGLTAVSWVADDGFVQSHHTYRVYAFLREHSTTLQPLAAADFQRATLTHPAGSYAVSAGIVSANYFESLGVRLVRGRTFTAEEADRGASGLIAVIGHELWQTTFEGTESIVGQQISVNGQPAVVVGVTESGFQGGTLGGQVDLWLPLAGELRERLQPNRSDVVVSMIGRLAPGASRRQAHEEFAALWAQLQAADPELREPAVFGSRAHHALKPRLVAYSATAGGDSLVAVLGDRMLAVFSIVTLLTIVIVCANVANLLIARAAVRQRELALRQSLGASRWRIVRSLLAEGLALSAVAWIAACLFAWWVSRAATTLLLSEAPATFVMPDITPDWTVVAYALVLAVIATVAVTLAPAWRIRRLEMVPFLKVGEQGIVQARSSLSRVLVVLQLAFSVLLLTTAGLAYRSLSLADALDLGFETGNVLLATINTGGAASSPDANRLLLQTLAGQIDRLPNVEQTSYVPGRNLLTPWFNFPVRRDGSAGVVLANDHRVSSAFFHTLGVPFVAGGDFTDARGPATQSVVITQALADALWPGEPAIGKTMVAGPPDRAVDVEVIGVVRNAHFSGRATEAAPHYIFFAEADRPSAQGTATFYIRFSGSPATSGPAVTRALREADPRVALAGLRSFDSLVAETAAPIRMLVTLLTLFAAGSLLIAAIGQYAVVAFDGRRRTREYGVRIALGASPPRLIASVLNESFKLTLVGLVVGFALSVAVSAVLSRFLFDITATDPPTYAGVFALLTAASLAACYLPARRAARIDPMAALRSE